MFFVAARQPDVLQSTNQDAMRLGNQNASLKTGKYISVMSSTINRLYSWQHRLSKNATNSQGA